MAWCRQGVGAAALFVARGMSSNIVGNRAAVLAVLGGVVLLGIITVAVSADENGIGSATAAGWFALPGLAVYSLLVPGPVRRALGPLFVESDPSVPSAAPQEPRRREPEQWG